MSSAQAGPPDRSMTLITEMMERPLDPGYAAAAESRERSGLPPATGHRSPMLVIVAILIGAMLATSALALRAPTGISQIKSDLVARIESRREQADAQARNITELRNELNAAQAAALSQQSQSGLASELSRLELAAGTVSVTGPGLVLTVDDAEVKADPKDPDVDPRTATEAEDGKVVARDLQMLVNGLWEAGAEAISVNGHRLTSRAAIRFAGAAILVDYRPLTRPYVITAIGDPSSLSVEFAGNSGGSLLQGLKTNWQIRSTIQTRDSVVVPGEPALSLEEAKALQSAVTKRATPITSTTAPPRTAPSRTAPPTTAPTTETPP